METLDSVMTHVWNWMAKDGMRFYHTAESSTQLKTYEMFVTGKLHLIVLEP
jgi:hypothetical protein